MISTRLLVPAALSLTMAIFSCAGTRPANLGVTAGRLLPCPTSPNCVSTDSEDEGHAIAPLELVIEPAAAWERVRAAVAALPRTEIVTISDDYLHAECSSAIFGFVDDLELHLRPTTGTVAVRAAARKGHSDFGVNRRRVEQLREALRAAGVVR